MLRVLGCCWNVIGWTPAADVLRREDCFYAILFERDAERAWIHANRFTIENIAEIVRENPLKIAPLR